MHLIPILLRVAQEPLPEPVDAKGAFEHRSAGSRLAVIVVMIKRHLNVVQWFTMLREGDFHYASPKFTIAREYNLHVVLELPFAGEIFIFAHI